MKFFIAAVSGIVAITLLLMVTGNGSVITSIALRARLFTNTGRLSLLLYEY